MALPCGQNKAINILRKSETHRKIHQNVWVKQNLHRYTDNAETAFNQLFDEQSLQDNQLRLMFTRCHPAIGQDSQIALMLKTLYGFSAEEIANAFITKEDNIKTSGKSQKGYPNSQRYL